MTLSHTYHFNVNTTSERSCVGFVWRAGLDSGTKAHRHWVFRHRTYRFLDSVKPKRGLLDQLDVRSAFRLHTDFIARSQVLTTPDGHLLFAVSERLTLPKTIRLSSLSSQTKPSCPVAQLLHCSIENAGNTIWWPDGVMVADEWSCWPF